MRETRLSGSVEGVVSNHDPYSDSLAARARVVKMERSAIGWASTVLTLPTSARSRSPTSPSENCVSTNESTFPTVRTLNQHLGKAGATSSLRFWVPFRNELEIGRAHV